MKKIHVSATARREILAIWEYIAIDSVDTADRVCNEIEKEFDKLADHPGLGHSRADVPNASYRFWSIYRYVIAYRVKGGTLFISRVVHGRRISGSSLERSNRDVAIKVNLDMDQQVQSPEVLAYAAPPEAANTRADIVRRASLWTVLCSVCATPSFIFAAPSFNKPAMFVGVAMFILFYTFATSTRAFLRFRERLFVRRTLYIGYVTRVVISIVFPLGMIADLIPGLISVGLVGSVFHGPFVGYGPGSDRGFVPTLLITMIQGTFVNALLSLFMLVVWAFQMLVCKRPDRQHGFPVELIHSAAGSISEQSDPPKSSR